MLHIGARYCGIMGEEVSNTDMVPTHMALTEPQGREEEDAMQLKGNAVKITRSHTKQPALGEDPQEGMGWQVLQAPDVVTERGKAVCGRQSVSRSSEER